MVGLAWSQITQRRAISSSPRVGFSAQPVDSFKHFLDFVDSSIAGDFFDWNVFLSYPYEPR